MGGGLATIVLLLILFSWFYRLQLNHSVITGLIKGSAAFIGLYFIIKLIDFTYFGKWGFVFGPNPTWETYLFRVEILLQVIIPLVIFLTPALRRRISLLLVGTGSALIGIVMHRLNTGVIGYFRSSGEIYIPTLSEFLLGFGILAGAGLLFFLLVERFYIFREPAGHGHGSDDAKGEPLKLWSAEEAKSYFLGPRLKKVIATLVIIVPGTWILMYDEATGPFEPMAQPVTASIIGLDAVRDTLLIDANMNDDGVEFPHAQHKEAISEEYNLTTEETCMKCHHLNMPNDNATNCRLCHNDMELGSPMFKPANHEGRFETEADWEAFHAMDLSNPNENYQACAECHLDNMKGLTEYAEQGFTHVAPGFQYAMHGSCMTCHRQRGLDQKAQATGEGNCLFCHKLPIAVEEVTTAAK